MMLRGLAGAANEGAALAVLALAVLAQQLVPTP